MFMLKDVRLSYPALFKPSAFGDADPKYSATFLIEEGSEQHEAIKAEIAKVAKGEFGDNYEAILKKQDSGQRRLLKVGNDKLNDDGDVADGYADQVFIKASNKAKPKVVGRGRQDLTEADGIPYGGCYVNAQLEIWPQNNKFGKFINIKLLAVQHWKDGDAFGSSSIANVDAFEKADDEGEW